MGDLFCFSFLSRNKFQRKQKLCKSSGILSQAFQTVDGKSFLPLPHTQATGVNYFSQVKKYTYIAQNIAWFPKHLMLLKGLNMIFT